MSKIFQPARWTGGGAPLARSMEYTSGESFLKGEVVKLNAGGAGTIEVCSANPQGVVGVALEGAGRKPGFEIGHTSQVEATTGRVSEASIALAVTTTTFSGEGSSDPALTNIGVDYGLAVSSNVWTVDFTEEGTVTVMCVDVDLDEDLVFFTFLPAVYEL